LCLRRHLPKHALTGIIIITTTIIITDITRITRIRVGLLRGVVGTCGGKLAEIPGQNTTALVLGPITVRAPAVHQSER
jgi:hypothetical protein